MDSSIAYFSLPFVDNESADFFEKLNPQERGYEDLHASLQPLQHSALLGPDDVLAQFLSGDEPLEEPDLNGPTTLHCEICKKKFDNAKKYYGHLRVHSKDNLWVCDQCPDQRFNTKQQLMKHTLIHKPLERMWKCLQCSMAFEALHKLHQHLFAKHLDCRPHKCDQCEKAFQKLSDLKKHKDTHSDVKRYACSECDTRFKDKSNLKRHMLRHNKEKPFSCPGCGSRFTQLASMKRHARVCAHNKQSEEADKPIRKNYCRVCGMSFQYKSALLEHTVSQHSTNPPKAESQSEPEKENIDNQQQTRPQTKDNLNDTSRIVDNIVDDILSAEDDYMTMSTQNEINNIYPPEIDNNPENLMQIELLDDMNQLHILDGELFYNDIDFDTIQPSHMFNNPNEIDDTDKNAEILFDFNNKSMDQDLMNVFLQAKGENLPEDLLNPEVLNVQEKLDENPVLVNECATIFESDVDLEASTNLAANLNQLIGENTVQYISTEHDDTFIISLNNEIDAEQLTDMLNIEMSQNNGVNIKNELDIKTEPEYDYSIGIESDPDMENEPVNLEPIIVKIEGPKYLLTVNPLKVNNSQNEDEKKSKRVKKCKTRSVLYVCRKCDKVFKKKDNYKSHVRAMHEPRLRQHKCRVCGQKFGYRSTLNKHYRASHMPRVLPAHVCSICDRTYSAKWMLRDHMKRNHECLTPHACDFEGCTRSFFKKSDLVVHKRYHTGECPFTCDICKKGFTNVSHLRRHQKHVDCTKFVNKEIKREPVDT